MNRTYESKLPEGYRPVLTLNAKSVRFLKKLLVLSLVLLIIPVVAGILLAGPIPPGERFAPLRLLCFCAVVLAYIPLHELTHGAVYKLLTRQKLTYGFTLAVAYCGVPNIYVYRRTALAALVAPLTLFSLLFLAGAHLLPTAADRFWASMVFAIHLSGCAGDIYDTCLCLTRFRDPLTLIRDTGPAQTFFRPRPQK